MYEPCFGLQRNPFSMTPDPDFLFLTPAHKEAVSGLVYAVLQRKGFVVLIGEAGAGKTTVLSRVLRSVPNERAHFSLVLSPTLSPDEFLESVLIDFGLTDIPRSKVQRLLRLQEFTAAAHAEGKTCVLVVDEAQLLTAEILEEIRLLTNFESAECKLLQVVLSGQRELRALLNREDLRQLKQRIAVRFELKSLMTAEVGPYIRFRWKKAGGGDEPPFHPDAILMIAEASKGVPRVVNAICDGALLLAYAVEALNVMSEHVRQVLSDLDIEEPIGPPETRAAVPAPVNRLHEAASAPVELRTLARYHRPDRARPLLMRWAERLRLGTLERKAL